MIPTIVQYTIYMRIITICYVLAQEIDCTHFDIGEFWM